ncbi:hypothetical protein QTP88_023358 [Uroleucon formosanum]
MNLTQKTTKILSTFSKVSEDELITELKLLKNYENAMQLNGASSKSIYEWIDWLKTTRNSTVYTCVFKTLKMFTIIPVTSCTCERVFSKLTIVKNKLRSTMSQERLESLLLLFTEQEIVSKVDLNAVIDEFNSMGMSKSIQNDLISCISEFLINQIKNEIKQCKFYSIQIDDTTDISQKTQCSIIIRYVTDKSELIERFLGFHNVSEDPTAQGLFNLVNSVLHEFDTENKLVGQCYDGACVMSGHLTGLQVRVKEVAPNALFTHCLAHRLNLVLQHGCSINAKCRIFFANLTSIAAYFHNSTSRTNFVDTIVGKRIPQFVQTRWSSRSKILHTIVNEWSGFIDVFDCISKDPKSSSESIVVLLVILKI